MTDLQKNFVDAGKNRDHEIVIGIVQDDEAVQNYAKSIARRLKDLGLANITIRGIQSGYNLKKILDHDDDAHFDALILDHGGAGHEMGAEVYAWHDRKHPDATLPYVLFLSLGLNLAVNDAAYLTLRDPRSKTGFVSQRELKALDKFLYRGAENEEDIFETIATNSFRRLLNLLCDLNLPETIDAEKAANFQSKFEKTLDVGGFEAWTSGVIPADKALSDEREQLSKISKAIDNKVMGLKCRDDEKTGDFFAGNGMTKSGKAVFSLEDVRNWPESEENPPILFMQNYDPDIIEELEQGRLGGIVLCSTYLASHLSFLCEANNVSGIFGLKPDVPEGRKQAFNELAKCDLPPYFAENQVQINGEEVKSGQDVIIRVSGNGIVSKPEIVESFLSRDECNMPDMALDNKNQNRMLSFKECMRDFAAQKNIPFLGVKANVSAAGDKNLNLAAGIGLVRSEQLVSGNEDQRRLIKKILLGRHEIKNYLLLGKVLRADYNRILRHMDLDYPVKMRLFDFSPQEFMTKKEQNQFHETYGRMDVQGGPALDRWPELYRMQIHAILKEAEDVPNWRYRPVQIIMPSIRTGEDTLKTKEMIKAEYEEMNAKGEYQFGVMIETLDACNNAREILPHCDFISFGTNDLTQQVLGIGRDDLHARGKYMDKYGFDPFKKMAPEVMDHIKNVCAIAREINPEMEIDLCGAQGAEIQTAMDLTEVGVNNISVAPNLENLASLQIKIGYEIFDRNQSTAVAKPDISAKIS